MKWEKKTEPHLTQMQTEKLIAILDIVVRLHKRCATMGLYDKRRRGAKKDLFYPKCCANMNTLRFCYAITRFSNAMIVTKSIRKSFSFFCQHWVFVLLGYREKIVLGNWAWQSNQFTLYLKVLSVKFIVSQMGKLWWYAKNGGISQRNSITVTNNFNRTTPIPFKTFEMKGRTNERIV